MNRLQFALQVPKNRGFGMPIPESISKLGYLIREEVDHTFICNDVSQRPGNLRRSLTFNWKNRFRSGLYLVVVLFMCGVERFDHERRMVLSAVIRRE